MSSPQHRQNTILLFREINGRQRIALLIPPAVAATMIPMFRLLSGVFENAVIGWYLGLVCYWLTWCTILPLRLVGKQRLKQILRPQKPNITVVLLVLFPDRILYRIIWPSIGFALWHYAPGSVSANSNPLALIIGAGLFGFILAFLAKKTGGIWWDIMAHVLGGIVMII